MKILAISHSCVVSEYQKRMAEVAKYSDVELTLVVPKHWFQFNKRVNLEKETDDHYRIISLQPVTWGFRKNTLRNVTHIYPRIKEILKNIEPDIIELWEEPFSAVTAYTSFVAKRIIPEAKIIFFSAQNVFKKYPAPFWAFEKYTYKTAHFAFLMNKEVIGVVRRKGYERKFTVLPLGVDTDIFRKKDVSSLKKRLGIRDFVVGFIGKITRQKGILHLIEAVSRISKKVQLLILGDGELRDYVVQLLDEVGLRQQTIFLESVPHSEIPDYLNCIDILVFPSITLPQVKEQFGRVIIEAMACGVPVIGSDSGEIPSTIDEAGLIFKEKDVKGLREKIECLMSNRDLRSLLAKKGKKRVTEHFAWKKIAEAQYQVYRELMS